MTSPPCSYVDRNLSSPKPDYLVVPEFSPSVHGLSSPSSLTVPNFFSSGHPLSRRASSLASSIFDLTFESDQLERGLRNNDVIMVQKILQLHHGKFPVYLHGSFLDKSSCDSRSRRLSHTSHVSQDVEILLRKSQTLIDRFDRRESVTTEADIPTIFRTALHVAIQHNSTDVIKLLLKYGVDPNESGINSITASRRGSSLSESSPVNNVRDLRSPQSGRSVVDGNDAFASTQKRPSNLTCDASSAARDLFMTNRYLQCLPEEVANDDKRSLSVIKIIPEAFDFSEHYTSDELYYLPPLFFAVAEGKLDIVLYLLKFGASPNVADRHGCTPLHIAANPAFYSEECALALLKYGAKIYVRNNAGVTPFQLSPVLQSQQKALISRVLSRKPVSFSCNAKFSGECQRSGSIYSTGVSRFFKRSKSKDARNIKDTAEPEMRERTSSVSSYKSLRSRHHSVLIAEEGESDASGVSHVIRKCYA